jgi:hypothetical protein
MSDTLANVIATVESGPFPYAMRFESVMYGRGSPYFTTEILEAAEKANHCNAVTARMICSTSWGLFQIMGFNLYSPAIALPIAIGPYLFDTEQQFNAFKRFVKINGFDADNFDFGDEATIERFARSYNGPGDVPNYVAKMKAAFNALPKEA